MVWVDLVNFFNIGVNGEALESPKSWVICNEC